MAITSGFFDSVSSDRVYNAEQMTMYFDGLVSDGVYESIGDRFLVSDANDGMKVKVGTGRAIIKSRWVKNDAEATLTLDPASSSANRIDAIVLRLDLSARAITLTVKKGTAADVPTLPAITRSASVWELYLASVYIAKSSTTPTSITDLRPSTYCGWVTGVVKQVNTADLFNQWNTAYNAQYAQFAAYIAEKEAAFEEWFETLTSTLTVDTSITKYQRVETLAHTTIAGTIIDIDIDDYNADTDILFVYVNGLFYNDGTNAPESVQVNVGRWFIIESGTGVSFNREFSSGDEISFIVIKNVIGGNVMVSGQAALSLYGSVNEPITGTVEEQEE